MSKSLHTKILNSPVAGWVSIGLLALGAVRLVGEGIAAASGVAQALRVREETEKKKTA